MTGNTNEAITDETLYFPENILEKPIFQKGVEEAKSELTKIFWGIENNDNQQKIYSETNSDFSISKLRNIIDIITEYYTERGLEDIYIKKINSSIAQLGENAINYSDAGFPIRVGVYQQLLNNLPVISVSVKNTIPPIKSEEELKSFIESIDRANNLDKEEISKLFGENVNSEKGSDFNIGILNLSKVIKEKDSDKPFTYFFEIKEINGEKLVVVKISCNIEISNSKAIDKITVKKDDNSNNTILN